MHMALAVVERVLQFMVAHTMARAGATLVVGVSGGPDSLCLLHVLAALRPRLGIELHVAHLDHQLRGAASDADADFVAQTAQAWRLPCTVESADVQAYAAASRLNLHDAARQLRYAFFARLAAQIGADTAAVGHTASDQAETVLMHLLRGAGTAGLSGMRPTSTVQSSKFRIQNSKFRVQSSKFKIQNFELIVVRPLLTTTRAEVAAYCAQHALAPRQDATNDETTYTRNRIRHELLPLLMTYNPQIVRALETTAAICAEDSAFIEQALDSLWSEVAHVEPAAVRLGGAAWQHTHPALQRAALRRAYTLLGGTATLTWEHTEQVLALAAGRVGRHLQLPGGLSLQADYGGGITLGRAANSGPQLAHAAVELALPGQIALESGWRLAAETNAPAGIEDQWSLGLDVAAIAPPLLVRARRAGDRIQLEHGHTSLQDLFVDAKIPRALRDRWPVIADTQQILWVAGLRAARGVRAAEGRPAVWIRIMTPDVEVASRSVV